MAKHRRPVPKAVPALPATLGSAEPPAIDRWLPLLLMAVVTAFLWPVVRNGFSPIDDRSTIFFNARLNPPQFKADGVGWYWSHEDLGLYVPVTYTIWALIAKATYVAPPDDDLIHLDPHVYHAASLLVHLANVLLVYFLIRSFIKARGPAFAGAAMYGLHPLQVESLAWISGLKDLLYTAASLASVALYLFAVRTDAGARRRGTAYIAGLLLVPIGMLCKPTAMVAPLVAGSLDWLLVGRPIKRVALSVTPYLLAALPLAIVAKSVQPGTMLPAYPLWERPIVAGASLAFYLWKLVLPRNLIFDYGWQPWVIVRQPWTWALAAVTAAVAIPLVAGRRRWPWVTAGGLVLLAGLLPVLGLSPFHYQAYSTVADHYMIFAMLGPAMVMAWLVSRFPRVGNAAASIALIAAGVASFHQLADWRTEEGMVRHILAVRPTSFMGRHLLGLVEMRRGQLKEAEGDFRLALQEGGLFKIGWNSLADAYAVDGRPDDAIAAFRSMRRALGPPESHDRLFDLAKLAADHGHREDVRKYFDEQLRVYPADAAALPHAVAPATEPVSKASPY